MECYLKSTIIAAGFSRYDFHRLENLAMVAPSMTLWSADQLTLTMYALYTLSLSSNLGNSCERFEHRSHLISRLSKIVGVENSKQRFADVYTCFWWWEPSSTTADIAERNWAKEPYRSWKLHERSNLMGQVFLLLSFRHRMEVHVSM